MEKIKLLHGDCLELMKNIPDGSVDAIITDPPYGTTACKWDSVIPFDLMWEQLNRIIKPNGAIVLFGSEPFSSALRISNINNYKYDWIWEKSNPANIALANKMPLKYHEIISLFYFKQPIYNKQMIERDELGIKRLKNKNNPIRFKGSDIQGTSKTKKDYDINRYDENFKNPSTILKFKVDRGKHHPTQKPVELMEYLIKTYTNENETVLDFTMGSGTTGVAAVNTNRHFIGIEKDDKYFEIAKKRINDALIQPKLF
jgi:site-specific DNA-methyltransferase (adenine-specific)